MPLLDSQHWMRSPKTATYHYFAELMPGAASPCGRLLSIQHVGGAGNVKAPKLCPRCRRDLQSRHNVPVYTRPSPDPETRSLGSLFKFG